MHDLALGKPTAEAKPPQPKETETPKAAEPPKTDSKAMCNTALDPKAKAGEAIPLPKGPPVPKTPHQAKGPKADEPQAKVLKFFACQSQGTGATPG